MKMKDMTEDQIKLIQRREKALKRAGLFDQVRREQVLRKRDPEEYFATAEADHRARLISAKEARLAAKANARAAMTAWRAKHSSRALLLISTGSTAARKRGVIFSLSVEWVEAKLDAGVCEVTGLPLVVVAGVGATPWAPALLLRDPAAGYTPENTLVVCWAYKAAKQDFTDADVLLVAKALVENSNSC